MITQIKVTFLLEVYELNGESRHLVTNLVSCIRYRYPLEGNMCYRNTL